MEVAMLRGPLLGTGYPSGRDGLSFLQSRLDALSRSWEESFRLDLRVSAQMEGRWYIALAGGVHSSASRIFPLAVRHGGCGVRSGQGESTMWWVCRDPEMHMNLGKGEIIVQGLDLTLWSRGSALYDQE